MPDDTSDTAGSDGPVFGAADRDEPELARVGRLLLAHEIDREIEEFRKLGHELCEKVFDGEVITPDDIEALENGIARLEHVLEDHAKPLAHDDHEQEAVVDLAEVHGEAEPEARDDARES